MLVDSGMPEPFEQFVPIGSLAHQERPSGTNSNQCVGLAMTTNRKYLASYSRRKSVKQCMLVNLQNMFMIDFDFMV